MTLRLVHGLTTGDLAVSKYLICNGSLVSPGGFEPPLPA